MNSLTEELRLNAVLFVKGLAAKRLPPEMYEGFLEGILTLELHCQERSYSAQLEESKTHDSDCSRHGVDTEDGIVYKDCDCSIKNQSQQE